MAQNVLITGASSGIGAAVAALLAENGYQVWGTSRKAPAPDGDQTPAGFSGKQSFRLIRMDVNDDDSVTSAVAQVLKEAGHIDVLINNAGYGLFGPVEEIPLELAKNQFETNVFGTLRVIQAVLPGMRERRNGLIINMTSLAGMVAIPFQSHYSASKHAVEAFSEALKQEVRNFGIKVVVVQPGDINTAFNDATVISGRPDSPYRKWTEASWRTIDVNLKKAPPPKVVARTILRILKKRSPAARYPSGDVFSMCIPFLVRILPDRTREWAIRMFYNINFR